MERIRGILEKQELKSYRQIRSQLTSREIDLGSVRQKCCF